MTPGYLFTVTCALCGGDVRTIAVDNDTMPAERVATVECIACSSMHRLAVRMQTITSTPAGRKAAADDLVDVEQYRDRGAPGAALVDAVLVAKREAARS